MAASHFRAFEPGETLCEGGATSGQMCGIVRGQVGVRWYMGSFDSDLAHIGLPGSWWGGGPVWDAPREGHVTARTDVDALVIDIRDLREIVDSTEGGWRAMGLLALGLTHLFATALDDMMVRDIRKRCLLVLLRLAGQRRQQLFPLPPAPVLLSQEELAGLANLSRTLVSEILHDLEARGLVSLHYRSIVINDPPGIAALASIEEL